jgi:hypothetical protein
VSSYYAFRDGQTEAHTFDFGSEKGKRGNF